MASEIKFDFGREIAKILPAILREITSRHETIFSRSSMAVSHIVVLELLNEKGPSTMSELAKNLNLTMGAATGIVDKMVKSGFVKRERSSEDRRVVNVELLKKGKQVSGEIAKARRELSNKMFSVLTEKEKHEYLRLLKKVYSGLTENG